jgi:alkanesulfonate monooxygenase SsuD/methylene tetrahydromethanopterin reductase-like flavin-dependent oxidoreductase (luciferase family)
MVATVDELSGGRVELGIGAGWYVPEHEPLGVPFPDVRERFDRLEEQLRIIRALWTQDRVDFAGRWYQLVDAQFEPKPLQRPHPPIVLGGTGRPRGLRLAALYATEFNFDDQPPERIAEVMPRLTAVCEEVGRDPGTLTVSALTDWPAGSPAEQADAVARFASVGVERLFVDILGGIVDTDAITDFGRRFIASEAAPAR